MRPRFLRVRARAMAAVAVTAIVASPREHAAHAAGAGSPPTHVIARIDEFARTLLYKTCTGPAGDPGCSLDTGAESLPIDVPGPIEVTRAVFAKVPIGGRGAAGARTALHVTLPLHDVNPGERAWEAILVPAATSANVVVASGPTGWLRGQPGERSGVRVAEVHADDGSTGLVIGEIHEERRICGQTETLILPRALDPATLTLRGVTLPRLSQEARDGATEIAATPAPADEARPLAPLLRATATSGAGSPAALTDGDPSTAWREERSGDGHGEFVTMALAAELPVDRLAFTLLPPAAGGPDEAAPRSVHLATGAHVYAVTFPPRAARGASFDVQLPEPVATGCLSVVLDRADSGGRAHPAVAIADVAAYGPFDGPGASVDAVALALNDDAKGDAAVQELARLGDDGLKATGAHLASFTVDGQRRALSVAESGSCAAAAPLFVAELGRAGVDREAAGRSERALRRCDREAAPSLLHALAAKDASVEVARVAAEVAPDAALPLLVEHVGAAPAGDLDGFRDALARAAERASAAQVRKALEASGPGAPLGPALALVRALGRRAVEVAPLATPVALRAAGAPEAARRYLAVDPLVALAATRAPSVIAALGALERDPAWTVRLRVAERADEVPELLPWAARAVDDEAPRVREAALAALARNKEAPPSVVAHAGEAEPWTFVRLAAVNALQADRTSGASATSASASANAPSATDAALARAADEDASNQVRTAAVAALASRGGPVAGKVVREELDRDNDFPEVRAEAARAAGALCLRDQADRLNELARPLTAPDASETARLVAAQALAALAHLHPPDLVRRVAPFASDTAPPESRVAAKQALTPTKDRCP